MLYSPHIVLPEKKQDPNAPPNQQQQQQAQPLPDDLGQTFPYWSPALDPNGVRPSHFIGSSSKISFVSLSHLRIYKDSPESEFAKISYDLKKDDKNPDVPDSMILVKTESANAFGKDETRDEMIQTYELLHGIKTLEYTFYQRDGNTWKKTKSWDNEKEENKNTYPDMIELKISVKGKKKQAFEGNFKMRPEIPLRAINPSY